MRDAETGRRYTDRLVRVWLRDGRDAWVLIHIEVQAQQEQGFARRMYIYNCRIYDRYEREVVSLAVLADESGRWRPSTFAMGRWGCETRFRFPVVKVRDFRARRADLEASDNPFATVILAHLAVQETRRSARNRFAAKLALVRRLYERGYNRERVRSLFRLIDWLLALPEDLETQLDQAIHQIEEERQMPYITGIERRGLEKGRQEGIIEGRQEGRQEGLTEGKRDAVRRLVRVRFGAVPEALERRIAAAEGDALDQLVERAALAQSVEDL